MRLCVSLLALTVGMSQVSAQAQQVPEKPPEKWSVQLRFYGTTDPPGSDHRQILIETSGIHPARITAAKPIYDNQGRRSVNSPAHNAALDEKERDAIYAAARNVILNHRIGEEPRQHIADGESVEIAIHSYDRKIAAVFNHSSAENSKECQALLKLLNTHLPEQFQKPIRR